MGRPVRHSTFWWAREPPEASLTHARSTIRCACSEIITLRCFKGLNDMQNAEMRRCRMPGRSEILRPSAATGAEDSQQWTARSGIEWLIPSRAKDGNCC